MNYNQQIELERLKAARSAFATLSGGSFILAGASCLFSDSFSSSPELSAFVFGLLGLASYCKSLECSDRIALLKNQDPPKTMKKVYKPGVPLQGSHKNLTKS